MTSGFLTEKSLLLITRAINDSRKFIEDLPDFDQTVLAYPLYEYEYFNEHDPSLISQDFERVIITSSQSLSYLWAHEENFKKYRFACVGVKTSEKLKEKGFGVSEKAPTASALLKMLKDTAKSKFLYVRGREISFDFKKFIQDQGGFCDEIIAYGTVPALQIPDEIKEKILSHESLMITLFSANAAETLEKLLVKEGLEEVRTRTKLLSISHRVIKSLEQTDWQKMYVCEKPDIDSMYALIQKIRERKS